MRRVARYLAVFEKEGRSFGASVPDLPGCVAAGESLAEVKRLIREAITLHVKDMIARGEQPPEPTAESEYVEALAS